MPCGSKITTCKVLYVGNPSSSVQQTPSGKSAPAPHTVVMGCGTSPAGCTPTWDAIANSVNDRVNDVDVPFTCEWLSSSSFFASHSVRRALRAMPWRWLSCSEASSRDSSLPMVAMRRVCSCTCSTLQYQAWTIYGISTNVSPQHIQVLGGRVSLGYTSDTVIPITIHFFHVKLTCFFYLFFYFYILFFASSRTTVARQSSSIADERCLQCRSGQMDASNSASRGRSFNC